MLRSFSTTELDKMRNTQNSSMQDICVVQVYSDGSQDSYGEVSATYTDGSQIYCGLDENSGLEKEMENLVYEEQTATIRLPIGTSVNLVDRIKVLYRYGELLSTPKIYDVLGEIDTGVSGIVLALRIIGT